MGGGFKVDLDDLRGAAKKCTRLASDVATCQATREADYASSVLADAVKTFRKHWGRALDDLRDDLTEGASRLTKTADAYEQTDEEVAERLRKVTRR